MKVPLIKDIWLLNLLLCLALSLFVSVADANPPTRVARLSYVTNAVSFTPARAKHWVAPTLNRPLTAGDRLWSDNGARAELQLGAAVVRIGSNTSLTLLNLTDKILQMKLDQGTLNLRIWRISTNQVYEINTPNLAFSIRKTGDYRFDVDRFGNLTTVSVRSGQGNAYGQHAVYTVVRSHQTCRFTGNDLRGYQCFELAAPDAFDRWSFERDRSGRNSISMRYVSPEVIGYQDLDAHGTWRYIKKHGYAWTPTRVAQGWAPYRFGHWSWIAPWGWTWIDDEPWGFAPFHYGRWIQLDGTWYWVPGRTRARVVYSPALVAFVGGDLRSPRSSGSLVAWFPLGPGEIYRPSYPVSREYFIDLNRSSMEYDSYAVKAYENPQINIIYINRLTPNAVSAVPAPVFINSQPVSQSTVNVSQQVIIKEPVKNIVPLAPAPLPAPSKVEQPVVKPPETLSPRLSVIKTPPASEAAPAIAPAQLEKLASKGSEAEKPAQLVNPLQVPAVVPPVLKAPVEEPKFKQPEQPHELIDKALKPAETPKVEEKVAIQPHVEIGRPVMNPQQQLRQRQEEAANKEAARLREEEAREKQRAKQEAIAAKQAADARLEEERAAEKRAKEEEVARLKEEQAAEKNRASEAAALKQAADARLQEEHAAEKHAKEEAEAPKPAEVEPPSREEPKGTDPIEEVKP